MMAMKHADNYVLLSIFLHLHSFFSNIFHLSRLAGVGSMSNVILIENSDSAPTPNSQLS